MKATQALAPMTAERLAEIRAMTVSKPEPWKTESPDIYDRFSSVCQRANTIPELLDEIDRLRDERYPITFDEIQTALNQGRIERKQAEGDHAWISLVNSNERLTAYINSMHTIVMELLAIAWRRGRHEFPPEDSDRLAEIEKLDKPSIERLIK